MSEDLEAREIAAEQTYVDEVYVQLDASTRNARALAAEGHSRGKLGHEGGLVERDAMVFQAAKRIAQLDAAHEGLVFGRLDLDPSIDAQPRYIGRIGVRNADRDVLLIDWRAPAAGVFYQATAATPSGVVRRRVLRSLHRTVIGVEDELLDQEAETDLPIVGEGALMAQLSRARDRSMHSIVATIQAEQDKAIRAPGKGVVSISGGPGTGKTVVALHRAAFLLYSDRRRYEGGGVLVVGPSGVFMRYIERVLPSLGETAVALRSLGEVVGGVRATRHDEPAVADVKGATRMAELLRRTARQHAPGAPTSFRIYWRDETLVLDPGLLGRLRRQLMSQGRRNRQLPRVAKTLLDAMWRQVHGERGRERGREAFEDDMLGHEGFVDFASAWWPPLDAQTVFGWLREPDFLARVGEGVISREEQLVLLKSWAAGDLSIEDVPLVDELRYALGDVPQRTDDERDLDETGLLEGGVDLQELTTVSEREYAPGGLAWSAADPPHRGRRLRPRPHRRGAGPHPDAVAHGRSPRPHRELDDRRRPGAVVVARRPGGRRRAGRGARGQGAPRVPPLHQLPQLRRDLRLRRRLRPRVGLDADLPEAVRRTGEEPRVVGPVARPRGRRARGGHRDRRPRRRAPSGSSCPSPAARRSTPGWRRGPSWPTTPPGPAPPSTPSVTPSGEDRVVVLTGLDTKGLEFDGIVVVSPQEIEDESATGRATLYVVLTRATQLLTTVG